MKHCLVMTDDQGLGDLSCMGNKILKTPHIDLYKTFCELAGVKLPSKMQALDGRSLLPLLKDPKAKWPDRELFVHCGRWNAGEREKAKFEKCGGRTPRWAGPRPPASCWASRPSGVQKTFGPWL